MDFRGVDKEPLTGLIPLDLCADFRATAGRERRSLSEAMSEALCHHLKVDPRKYGIAPTRRRRSKAGATA